jgi:two-component system, NarL family, sensor kinase
MGTRYHLSFVGSTDVTTCLTSTMEQRPSERERQMALRQMVEDISSELELAPLLARIVQSACELIGADDGTIGLYDAMCDVIRTEAVYRMPARELGTQMRRGEGLAGRVLESGAPVIARYGDLARINLTELAENRVIGLPIHWRGRLVGFFGVGAAPPKAFDSEDVMLLELFARHTAIAIDNAQRYNEERRRAARFALIAEVTATVSLTGDLDLMLQRIADSVHQTLGFANIDIPLVEQTDPNTLVIRIRGGDYKRRIQHEDRLPIARGIMGAAVREKRTQLVNDVASDPRYVTPPGIKPPQAELAIPIQLRGEVLGVLNIESETIFDSLDVTSLEIVASHVAVAIENTRLVARSREAAILGERQRLARELHDNVTQILSSMSLLSQSLPQAWRRDPAEGERRALRVHELAQTGFAELRALLRELTPPEAPRETISRTSRALIGFERLRGEGLPAALEPLLRRMLPDGISLGMQFGGYVQQELAHEEALYRVCQEAVSNAIKHARAHQVEVTAQVSERLLMLTISDDGDGIPAARRKGLGLTSMRERLEALGGVLRILPRAPRGTVIECALPRKDRG